MAPAFRGGRRNTCCKARPGLRLKKKSEPSEQLIADDSSTKSMSELEEKNGTIDVAISGYSTPKAKKSRIPKHLSCPPAPKKRRITALHRPENTPSISFFASPDLDLFFLYALHEISL